MHQLGILKDRQLHHGGGIAAACVRRGSRSMEAAVLGSAYSRSSVKDALKKTIVPTSVNPGSRPAGPVMYSTYRMQSNQTAT